MAEPSIVLDPNGDLLIIVSAPTGAFAIWDEPHGTSATQPRDNEDDQEKGDDEVAEAKDVMKALDTSSGTGDDDGNAPGNELRIKASSRHLALASQRFGRMLANSWPDLAVVDPEKGLRHWTTDAVDLAAFAIVMDIVHGRNRGVPRAVDLDTLAKIAVIVDDLQCHEAVEVFADMWIRALEPSASVAKLSYSRELVLWTLVASVFHHAEIFRECTRIAIRNSTGPMPSLELPIRGKVIDTVESWRLELIDSIIASVYDLIDRLRDGKTSYSFECESMSLGGLIKQIYSCYLLYPRPSRPYAGLSVSTMISLVRSFRTPKFPPMSLVFNEYDDDCGGGSGPRECGFETFLTPEMNALEARIKGLDLENDLGYAREGA
ncbi:hypothetical protein F5X99DRAFT_181922 [Biscogniauxia marginata]|nr:hypothetical protein F5X99DRAFT_181922 [Biscogniauxia marginata]